MYYMMLNEPMVHNINLKHVDEHVCVIVGQTAEREREPKTIFYRHGFNTQVKRTACKD